MTFLASYTYSKVLTDSSGFNSTWINFTNHALSKSLAQFDMRQNFVISYAYQLPFGRFHSLPNRLTQGWSINGITRFTTGFPVYLSEPDDDRSLVGSTGVDVPDLVGRVQIQNPRLAGPQGPNQYFSASSFAAEPLGQFGSANRAFFSGPGLNNWDFALHKETVIRESMKLEFRAEYFNLFNHTQFMNPVGNFNSSQFGLVTSAQNPRIGQMSLKFLF